MTHFAERLRGEQVIREMKEADEPLTLDFEPRPLRAKDWRTAWGCGPGLHWTQREALFCGNHVRNELDEQRTAELERQNRIVDPCQDQQPWDGGTTLKTQSYFSQHPSCRADCPERGKGVCGLYADVKACVDGMRPWTPAGVTPQQSRCLNGEHEAGAAIGSNVPLFGADTDQLGVTTFVGVCRHCRSLFVPREA